MIFTAPIWLGLLVPWVIAVIWVFLARSRRTLVPTTQFWDASQSSQATRRAFARPPLGILLLMLAALLAILGAAGLSLGDPLSGRRITVVLDRYLLSTSAVRKDIESIDRRLSQLASDSSPVDLILVPDRSLESTDVATLRKRLTTIRPTAIDTEPMLSQIVALELARTKQPIVVITSQALHVSGERITELSPQIDIENAGIERFSVAEGEHPQALVRIWNGTHTQKATLWVDQASQPINLPEFASASDFYIDLPTPGITTHARLELNDDIAQDNDAYLVRTGRYPRLKPQVGLSPAAERMVQVYSRLRLAADDSADVVVTSDPASARDKPAAIIPTPVSKASGNVQINADEKLTRQVNWHVVLKNARITPAPAGGGWRDLVSVAGQSVVAIRDEPARQVWVGIDSPEWATRPDYVVFFTDLFDYLGSVSRGYTALPPTMMDSQWRRVEPTDAPNIDAAPGVYRGAGGLVAVNTPVIKPLTVRATTEPAQQIAATGGNFVMLQRYLLIASLVIVAAAAFCLTRSGARLG